MSIRDDVLGHLKLKGPGKTSEIADALALEPIQTSNALSQLRTAGLVVNDRESHLWMAVPESEGGSGAETPRARKPRADKGATRKPRTPRNGNGAAHAAGAAGAPEPATPKHYDIVIADLMQKRAAIDTAIESLRKLQ